MSAIGEDLRGIVDGIYSPLPWPCGDSEKSKRYKVQHDSCTELFLGGYGISPQPLKSQEGDGIRMGSKRVHIQ
jgi:hypothetical protein